MDKQHTNERANECIHIHIMYAHLILYYSKCIHIYRIYGGYNAMGWQGWVPFKCISNCLPYAKCSSLVRPLHKYSYIESVCRIEGVLPYAWRVFTSYKSINILSIHIPKFTCVCVWYNN